MKCLITLDDETLAHRLLWKLEEAGIRATVMPDTAAATGIPKSQVWIADAKQELSAREIISAVIPVQIRRNTKCPQCNYDLRGHAGRTHCPECGAEVHAGEVPFVDCAHCGHRFQSSVAGSMCPKCRHDPTISETDVHCPKCGAEGPAHFEMCWNCGAERSEGRAEGDELEYTIRLASVDDLQSIVDISNHYALTTPANFAVEPESLAMWRESFVATNEKYPWLVAVANEKPSPPAPLPMGEGSRTIPSPGVYPPRRKGEGDGGGGGRNVQNAPMNAPAPTLPLPPPSEGGVRIVGFAKASPWKGRCAYAFAAETTVYVHHEHLGKGIGRALYEPLFAMLRAQGYRTLLGGITVPNEASVKLHESFGMKKVAHLERVGWKFEKWHDVGYWELQLARDADSPPGKIRAVRDVVNDVLGEPGRPRSD